MDWNKIQKEIEKRSAEDPEYKKRMEEEDAKAKKANSKMREIHDYFRKNSKHPSFPGHVDVSMDPYDFDILICCSNCYNQKEDLKKMGYSWDSTMKTWNKYVDVDDAMDEAKKAFALFPED